MLPKLNQAMATDNMHRKFAHVWTCRSWEMHANRQTDRQTNTLNTWLCSPIRVE